MSSLFLTPDELRELTDATLKRLQVQWLDSHGWTYVTSRMGNPKVLRAYMEQRLGLGEAKASEETEPDWSRYTNGRPAK